MNIGQEDLLPTIKYWQGLKDESAKINFLETFAYSEKSDGIEKIAFAPGEKEHLLRLSCRVLN